MTYFRPQLLRAVHIVTAIVLPCILLIRVDSAVAQSATDALNQPVGITLGAHGDLWVVNHGSNTLSRISRAGSLATSRRSYTCTGPQIAIASIGKAVAWTCTQDIHFAYDLPGPMNSSVGNAVGYVNSTIAAGPGSIFWFASRTDNTIGTASVAPRSESSVCCFRDPSIDQPSAITAGPDGAMWFTNYGNNSVGRITTSGSVSNFTDPSIDQPSAIISGPGGVLWFTNYGNNSVGRITTSGIVISQPGVTRAPIIKGLRPRSLTVGSFYSINMTSSGYPAPSISEEGALPTGLTFTDNGNGAATLAGSPGPGSAGTYPITLHVANGIGSPASKNLTLVVKG